MKKENMNKKECRTETGGCPMCRALAETMPFTPEIPLPKLKKIAGPIGKIGKRLVRNGRAGGDSK